MLPPIPPPFFFFPNPATFAAAIRAVGGAGTSTLLAYVLVQHLWKHTPEWIREDESWQALLFAKGSKRAIDNNNKATTMNPGMGEFVDEMASLTEVVQKLEALVVTGYDKLGSQRGQRRRRRAVRRAVDSLRRKKRIVINDTVASATTVEETNEIDSCQGHNVLMITTDDGIDNNNNDDNVEQEIISPLEWHASLLAYWQLCNQIRKRYPSWRDEFYDRYHNTQEGCWGQKLRKNDDSTHSSRNEQHSTCYSFSDDFSNNRTMKCNKNNIIRSANNRDRNNIDRCDNNGSTITSSQIKELQSMLLYAVWAYESNEDRLRSFLLSSSIDHDGKNPVSSDNDQESSTGNAAETTMLNNGGYQLIVHRTTSYVEPINVVNTAAVASPHTNSFKKKRKPPGRVGYFVAVSHVQRTLLIGMKGTSTLEELLTDCCGRAVRVDLDNDPHGYFPPTPPSISADNDDGCNETDQGFDDTVNDTLIPSLQPQYSAEDIIHDKNNPQTPHDRERNDECEECDNVVDEELVHVNSSTGDNISACMHSDESIEVELLQHGSYNDHRRVGSSLAPSLDNVTSVKPLQGHRLDGSSKSKKSSSRNIPSADNVLLSPSVPASSSTRNINLQNLPAQSFTPELDRSPTDEYMECNCVEMEEHRSHKLRGVHEGILHCAQQLLFEISPLIEEYALSKGYDVVCTGHSLGAGTGVILAILIRGKYPELTGLSSSSSKCGGVHPVSGINSGERVRAYAFAPPPVLDRESSLACRRYVISVINGSDIIPRSSLTNLDSFLTILEAVRGRLVEAGMNPGSSKSVRQQQPAKMTNIIASTMALFCKLCEGTDGDLLLDPTELRLVLEEAIEEASIGDGKEDIFYWDEEFGHHLFAPGRVLLLYEDWSSSLPTEFGTEEVSLGELNVAVNFKGGKCHAMWTDGTNSVLKAFEIGAGSGMITDHLTTSYQRSLETCQTQLLKHDQ